MKAMVDAVKDLKQAAFFLKKEKPYWWNLKSQLRQILNESQAAVKVILEKGPAWVKDQAKTKVTAIKDQIALLTDGSSSVVSYLLKI